ncbi:MAG: V-type ATPase 116kDa subunit family protein [candidate division WOR-3 bacterium]
MAIAKVEKILIALHKLDEHRFLKRLQSLGILHLCHKQIISEHSSKVSLKEIVDELNSVIEYLSTLQKESSVIDSIFAKKTPVARAKFEELGRNYNFLEILNKVKDNQTKIQELEQQIKNIVAEINFLKPWVKLKYSIEELLELKHFKVYTGIFHSEADLNEIIKKISGYAVYYEIVNQEKIDYYVIIIVPLNLVNTIYPLLDRMEIVNLAKYRGTINEIITKNLLLHKQLSKEIDEYRAKLQALCNELPRLKVIYDYYTNLIAQEEVKNYFITTKEVIFIEGWLKSKDMPKLKQLIQEFDSAVFTTSPVSEEEPIPVALENSRLFKPFEIILELYAMPQPNEIDPTPFLAPFFAIFFALCLTDAGYGVLLTALCVLLLKKLKITNNKLLKLLGICGGVTIIAGALTGSWFGDIVDKIGLNFLVQIKNSLIVFDPLKNPLPFFYLSLAIGYIHLNYGIIIEIYDSLRQKQFAYVLTEQIPWFILINSLVGIGLMNRYLLMNTKLPLILMILFSISTIIVFTRRSTELIINQILWYGLLSGILILIATYFSIYPTAISILKLAGKILASLSLFSLLILAVFNSRSMLKNWWLKILFLTVATSTLISTHIYKFNSYVVGLVLLISLVALDVRNRKVIKNFAWGLYNLYNGTSFLGIILSYIRLMALGMVTAGIAMAINTIAWMIFKLPVLGIIVALILLAFGHLYNFLINILGAFVHSLRLNYVEFFPRFFTGGGEKFTPFSEDTKYIIIEEGGKL